MKLLFGICLFLWFAFPTSLEAEERGTNIRSGLFNIEGLTLSDSITFDAETAARNEIDLKAPFRISVPRDPYVARNIFANPTGGALVGIMFRRAQDQTGTDADLLEHVQITGARIPMAEQLDPQGPTRLQLAGQMARDMAFPHMVAEKEGAELLDVSFLRLGEIDAVQVVGRHLEPEIGPVLIRIVIVPHPDQVESLMIVARINLANVPVTDQETLEASLSGRVISSWEYR